ncbi:hypothetical protein BRO54_1852 [Geobacillus proteiniphilus]|uniref:Uncharacterized protein n=1 Tax=Geobacillus proteiniphilus TaxID=860353 RepID=A0A1Q5T0A1_9BACL|nr:hypothetical protein BRO54_1852 [Geobacillus proteiniphilus]
MYGTFYDFISILYILTNFRGKERFNLFSFARQNTAVPLTKKCFCDRSKRAMPKERKVGKPGPDK